MDNLNYTTLASCYQLNYNKGVNKFRFWAAVITPTVLGIAGLMLANAFPLPPPATTAQTKLLYALVGVLVGLLIFASVTSWIVKTTTRLMMQLTSKIASDVINQFTHLASSGIPWPSRQPAIVSGAIILDTSAIIDGRVLDIAKSKFISGLILLPNFVLSELQNVADSSDQVKRARGRAGFETVEAMKKLAHIKVEIWDKSLNGKAVDERLIRLGKMVHGKILTVDFNLNKVASVSGVTVLNINELANALKTIAVPGESLRVKIIQSGKDKNQGVGYLTDGTMVVVSEGAGLIGRTTQVEVIKVLQIPAGRMIFGKIIPSQ